jgi:predicted NUDIX family NTP pyrophosphohydrolase
MPKQSAGLLLYRRRGGRLEVFLVHPGGPEWTNKDLGAWSVPKGEYLPEENPLAAAEREFEEETGFKAEGEFLELVPRTQPSGKVVRAWAFEGDGDENAIRSNSFRKEWPPRSGHYRDFPEVDRGGWFGIEEAKKKILKGQVGFLDELQQKLSFIA